MIFREKWKCIEGSEYLLTILIKLIPMCIIINRFLSQKLFILDMIYENNLTDIHVSSLDIKMRKIMLSIGLLRE